jgi:hypothetical protein
MFRLCVCEHFDQSIAGSVHVPILTTTATVSFRKLARPVAALRRVHFAELGRKVEAFADRWTFVVLEPTWCISWGTIRCRPATNYESWGFAETR